MRAGALIGKKLAAAGTGTWVCSVPIFFCFWGSLLTIMGLTRISYVTLWKKCADPAGRRLLETMQGRRKNATGQQQHDGCLRKKRKA